ncbi:hypothetical protein EDD70_2368 [Hydrogenoanaerobacterium saccharovorans]|uniref:DUF7660 domain-containing protein n=1 Tax=Hydrogenoanaerobacterium saccharovorans TaxID=474960 RepID=A0A1H8CZP5_9FIRM|nr:hypothetical protein [Hydrogenoanaerobacterium saccharovorans]RPF43404.1 hypothetical protein EDD70_2368 [Hydrogenoanaerobacterium saccharovorans]SEN00466.1 hypothetical protein SAMN05216180_2427 [Hydrogenoanaerobacterium saccharovorans]
MNEILKNVKSKEDLLEFINVLIKDLNEKPEEWEDKPVMLYLESMQSWIEDMEGYYTNTKQDMPQDINWNFIATLLYVGKIYE